MSETIQERQENEIEALKAIFAPSEFKDLRETDVWHTYRPPDVILTVTPQQGSSGPAEVYAKIDLHIKCDENYPEKAPKISLENSKGLSAEHVDLLSAELANLADNLLGEVMIYELSQHVRKYLLAFNKRGFQSFYEEMQARQAQQEEQKELLRKQVQDKERQNLQEHIQRKQQALKEEERQRKEVILEKKDSTVNNSSAPPVPVSKRQRGQSSSSSSDRLTCSHRGTKLVTFSEKQVRIGQCLGHSNRGKVVYAGQDVESGELIIVSQWKVKCSAPRKKGSGDPEDLELTNIIKQVTAFEQEIHMLQKLSHPGIIKYRGITQEHVNDHMLISILQDFAQGVNLALFLQESICVGPELLQHIAKHALGTLAFLHRNNVVHRDFRHSSVYLLQSGAVMLSNYSLDSKVGEFIQGTERADCGLPPPMGRGAKKGDVFRLGCLLLSLFEGSPVTTLLPVPPSTASKDLQDFLQKCLERSEQDRWSADKLLNHPYVRTSIDRQMSPQKNGADGDRDELSDEEESDLKIILPSMNKGSSRVQTEFEVLKWLGKGAFGDVLKVRNKLDARFYALKRIKLNPRNRALNRKITRECKLLSRLNHENVVRYYNSWIESALMAPSDEPDSMSTSTADVANPDSPVNSILANAGVEWSVSCEARPQFNNFESDTSSSDEDEDAGPWAAIYSPDKSSSIVFEGGLSADEESECATDTIEESSKEGSAEPKEIQFLYIQMEFCEKSTLRTAIDSGELHSDIPRVWRLFREIVEGLAHIHRQGMIHRDLKPVNVFMDIQDHVKIGDFGLATSKSSAPSGKEQLAISIVSPEISSQDFGNDGGALTGLVGTALYSAPELNITDGQAIYYNQKVDIYSLGIIFFEMCHAPLGTTMERVKVLLALRQQDIVLPADFTEEENPQQVFLIKWLLNHDPSKRPSAQELLKAECLLPMQREELALQELLNNAFENPQSKVYKHLVSSLMSQEVNQAEDLTFDIGMSKSLALPRAMSAVRPVIEKIFLKHGAVRLASPLLVPKSSASAPVKEISSSVTLMTHSGSVVTLPHDLRVPFARFAAWNGITSLKRYSIEKVYRERRVYGVHPRELYECAFDIITPNLGCQLAEAELLTILWEVLKEFSEEIPGGAVLRLNHTSLIRAILLNNGIDPEKHDECINIIQDSKESHRLKTLSQNISSQSMENLATALKVEAPLNQLHTLKALAKGRGATANLAKEGLKYLESVINAAEAMGVKCPMIVAPGLVLDSTRYSGFLCQLCCENPAGHHRRQRDVVAVGGNYTQLLTRYRDVLENAQQVRTAAIGGSGISVSLDRLAAILQKCADPSILSQANTVISSLGAKVLQTKAPELAKLLWAAGVKAHLVQHVQGIEEAEMLVKELGATHLVLLKDSDPNVPRVRTLTESDKERFQEKKVQFADVVELITRKCSGSEEASVPSVNSSTNPSVIQLGPGINAGFDFHFVTNEKLAYNTRKRYENQMAGYLANLQKLLNQKTHLEVIALSVEGAVIKFMAANLEFRSGEEDFNASVSTVIEKYSRHRKYLAQVCDKIYEIKLEKKLFGVVLYSLMDNVYRTLF